VYRLEDFVFDKIPQFEKHPVFWKLLLCPSTENNISAKFTDVIYNEEIKIF
jgi:hypothetical protein